MISLLIDGIAYGLQLAMLAVGLSLLYGLAGVLNLAHGQFVAVAAIAAATMIGTGIHPLAAISVGLSTACLLALIVDRTIMRAVYNAPPKHRVLMSLLLTLGVAFTVDGILFYRYPYTALAITPPVPTVEVFGVLIRGSTIAASALSLVALGVMMAFLRFGIYGKVIRSIMQNETGAELCGVNPRLIRTVVWILGSLFAGLVAITQAMATSVSAGDGQEFTVFALVVTVVGGLGSVAGALVAGVLLGVVHALSAHYLGAYLTFAIFFSAAGLTILVRPTGILGTGSQ